MFFHQGRSVAAFFGILVVIGGCEYIGSQRQAKPKIIVATAKAKPAATATPKPTPKPTPEASVPLNEVRGAILNDACKVVYGKTLHNGTWEGEIILRTDSWYDISCWERMVYKDRLKHEHEWYFYNQDNKYNVKIYLDKKYAKTDDPTPTPSPNSDAK